MLAVSGMIIFRFVEDMSSGDPKQVAKKATDTKTKEEQIPKDKKPT